MGWYCFQDAHKVYTEIYNFIKKEEAVRERERVS